MCILISTLLFYVQILAVKPVMMMSLTVLMMIFPLPVKMILLFSQLVWLDILQKKLFIFYWIKVPMKD